MLAQRPRRWANIELRLCECAVFAGGVFGWRPLSVSLCHPLCVRSITYYQSIKHHRPHCYMLSRRLTIIILKAPRLIIILKAPRSNLASGAAAQEVARWTSHLASCTQRRFSIEILVLTKSQKLSFYASRNM